MDDRRFDSLVKALATGTSRRTLFRGLLGLGGAAAVGGAVLDDGAQAARRPTPTPTPIRCPGNQTPVDGVCTCPASTPDKCGPDCCNPAGIGPSHSECCDNACCFGTCYGEELCCATNDRSIGGVLLPPTNRVCDTVDGLICCLFDDECCIVDGCCDTVCFGGSVGADFCCPDADFCPGGSETEGICCLGDTTCCRGGTNERACVDLTVEGNCCVEGDCEDPFCEVCNLETHTCGPRCDPATQVCCTEQAGPGVCVTGDCCLGAPCNFLPDDDDDDDDGLCCQTPEGTLCLNVEVCPDDCECPEGTTCCLDAAGAIICVLAESCDCDEFCGPVETGPNTGNYYCCTEPDYTICCEGAESECCGGPAGRECQATGHCCEAATPFYCPGDGSTEPVCCATPCNPLNGTCTPSDACEVTGDCLRCEVCVTGLCQPCAAVGFECCPDGVCRAECEAQLCLPEGQSCPNAAGLACCEGLTCCGGQCCASANCCEDSEVCCGPNCARCVENICVEDCRVGLCLCLEGQTCDPQTGICTATCEPNCDCSDPANDTLDCNGGLAAGGGVCGCGFCVVPLDGCPCGCEGDTECVQCDGGDCVAFNEGGVCNGTAVCFGIYCDFCHDIGGACSVDSHCCNGLCDQGACVNCKQPGGTCDAAADCCSSICTAGVCAAP